MKLWPNLGCEAGPDSPALQRGQPLRQVAVAWSLLFGRGVELLARERGQQDARAWPEALGAEPEGACWPWLEPAGVQATAWWPDSVAVAALSKRGLAIDAPDEAVLREVHDKAFALAHARGSGGLGGGLEDLLAVFGPKELQDPSAVESVLAGWPGWAREHWVLKPRFGTSGRGRVHSTELVDAERFARSLPRLVACGGAILEPWLARVADYSVQLIVHEGGVIDCLGSLRQIVRAGGAALGGAGELDPRGLCRGAGELHDLLVEAALPLARAAAARGFRGPCSVDSFTWRDEAGDLHLRAVCELNARFTTGHVAIGCALRAREGIGREGPFEFRLFGGQGLALSVEGGPVLRFESV